MPSIGTRQERGYGRDHELQRERWAPIVDHGEAYCHAIICLEEAEGGSRWIIPGTPWHLGHNADRTAWTGPEHPRCNTTDGAKRGNARRRRTERPRPRPRRPLGW